jgi:FkbM family methyltransferase
MTKNKFSLLESTRTWIAAHRDNVVLATLASFASKYLRAYDNKHNWDVRRNGERFALQQILKGTPGDIFDVGANAGQWALMAAEVAPDRRIHSFELSPATYARLVSSTSGNTNIIANPFGLGEQAGEVSFHYYPESDDRTSLFDINDGWGKQQASGRIERGDAYVASSGTSHIAFLKLDVEGAEMSVLRGLHDSLTAGRITAVQFEHSHPHVATRHLLLDFIEFFRPYGFRVCHMFPNRISPIEYSPSQEDFTGSNFLAVREPFLQSLTR